MIKQHVEQPDGSEPMGVCDCGFAADECGTNPCMRKKIHLAGLTPGSKWPNTGQPAPAAPSSASVAGDTRSADAPRKALDGAGWPSPILPKCQQCLCTPLHCNCAVYSAYMPAPAQPTPDNHVAWQRRFKSSTTGEWGDWEASRITEKEFRFRFKYLIDSGECEIRYLYAAQPPAAPVETEVRCYGCGSLMTASDLAKLKAEDPKIISCCPERKPLDIDAWMTRALEAERKLAAHSRLSADMADAPDDDDNTMRDDPMFNRGVQHVVDLLAKTLSPLSDWHAGDGSEDYDCDLEETLRNILAAKGLYDHETGEFVSVAQPQEVPKPKRGFAFPEITINWDEINAMQFANSRKALMAKLERFMSPESKDTAYWSDNHFNRSEMYVLHELLKASSAVSRPQSGGARG